MLPWRRQEFWGDVILEFEIQKNQYFIKFQP